MSTNLHLYRNSSSHNRVRIRVRVRVGVRVSVRITIKVRVRVRVRVRGRVRIRVRRGGTCFDTHMPARQGCQACDVMRVGRTVLRASVA